MRSVHKAMYIDKVVENVLNLKTINDVQEYVRLKTAGFEPETVGARFVTLLDPLARVERRDFRRLTAFDDMIVVNAAITLARRVSAVGNFCGLETLMRLYGLGGFVPDWQCTKSVARQANELQRFVADQGHTLIMFEQNDPLAKNRDGEVIRDSTGIPRRKYCRGAVDNYHLHRMQDELSMILVWVAQDLSTQ